MAQTNIEKKHQGTGRFLSAIQTNGSVGECLDAVIRELDDKRHFVTALAASISERTKTLPDAVTDMGQRIRILENTLRFRLSILSPERKGAWFRPAGATTGPFKEPLYTEPVFSSYDENQHGQVRRGLAQCWETKSLLEYPLRATEPSLWKVLLTLNFELEKIDRLSYCKLRLTDLPEALPETLESRSLRAFLTNVRAEMLSHRLRLTEAYLTLIEACERYWRHNASSTAQKSPRAGEARADSSTYVPLRDRRTQTTKRPRFKTSSDIEALRFMGFSDYPDWDGLKQRYHALALTMHPDRPTGNEQRFKMLTKSYKHLSKICKELA